MSLKSGAVWKCLLNILVVVVAGVTGNGNGNAGQLSRKARALPLLFPPTAPTRIQWIVGIGIPLADLVFEALTTGYVLKAEYFLPETVEQLKTKTSMAITVREFDDLPKFEQHLVADDNDLRINSTLDHITTTNKKTLSGYRWSVYKGLEGLATSLGLSGRACVLKSICEAVEVPFAYENGMFGELLHILLTPSSSVDALSSSSDNEYHHAEFLGRSGVKCDKIFRNCPRSLLEHFSDINVLTANIAHILG